SYRFRVRAISPDGGAGPQAATIAFVVDPPFWRRGSVLVLAALGGTALLMAAHRWRVRRVLEVANMRTRIATDLHDDIGANLTTIAILAEVIRRDGTAARTAERLHTVADLSRESVASMSDIVWAVSP